MSEIEKTKEGAFGKIARELGEDVALLLNESYSILGTKLLPLFVKIYKAGLKEGKEEAKKEFLEFIDNVFDELDDYYEVRTMGGCQDTIDSLELVGIKDFIKQQLKIDSPTPQTKPSEVLERRAYLDNSQRKERTAETTPQSTKDEEGK